MKPIDASFVYLPSEIFLHTGAFVQPQLYVHVIGGAAGGYLGHKLGRAFDIVVYGNVRAIRTVAEEARIGLDFAIVPQKNGGIIHEPKTTSIDLVGIQP